MVDNTQIEESKNSTEEKQPIIIDDDFIREYSSNTAVIKFIQSKFKRLSRLGAINLIKLILQQRVEIEIRMIMPKWKGLFQYNMGKFDEHKKLKLDEIKSLRRELNGFLIEIGKDIPYYEDEKGDIIMEEEDGEKTYRLDKHVFYKKVQKLICDEGGDAIFKYDFKNPDMELMVPINKDTIQRCQIQILSTSIKFDYPIEFEYQCPQCGGNTQRKAYETASTNNRIKCPNIYSYINGDGDPRSRVCNLNLVPYDEISLTKDAFYYDICYEDIEQNKHTAGAISFIKLDPGFYECVLLKIKNPKKTEVFHIMDVCPVKSHKFEFPKKKDDENYVITLQKTFDKFIKERTGMEIYGLFPIKIAMILQTAINYLGFKLSSNIQIVGDPSTGKSTILKYYGFLLNNHLNLSSNGLSISVAGLRGTRHAISLMGKEQKIVTTGYLGTFRSIHIDEAGENKELIQNLKTFLFEDNYGYDKAGATGVFNKRTAHINLSENLDFSHLGQYRGTIRKAYKDMNVKIGDEEKEAWNENWDLHLPIFKYDNLYLRKVIREKRIEYQLKQQFWIDGYDYALHERFPFYFYLVNEKQDDALAEVIKGNVARDTISENLQLMRALKSDDIIEYFKNLVLYKDSENNSDAESFKAVDIILNQYGVIADSRVKEFFYNLVKVSRIINKRKSVEEEDYNLLRWVIEKINCKIDVTNTVDYKIQGPPDMKKESARDMEIEDMTKEIEDDFGLPVGEFE